MSKDPYVRVYFDLFADDDESPWDEWAACHECERILDVRLSNEGYDGYALVCCFGSDDLDALRARIRPFIGNGDDAIFLPGPAGGVAQSFCYTPHPGMIRPVPLFDDE